MTKEEYKMVKHEMGKDALKAMFYFFIVGPLVLTALVWLFVLP